MLQAGALEAGLKPATVARRLSVLRGTYQQLAAKGLIPWETAQDIQARGPGRILNISPGEDRCFLLRCYRNPFLSVDANAPILVIVWPSP